MKEEGLGVVWRKRGSGPGEEGMERKGKGKVAS